MIDLKRLDEFINRIVMFQSDVQEFRREIAELNTQHEGKRNELVELEATAKARRAEMDHLNELVSGVVEKLSKFLPKE